MSDVVSSLNHDGVEIAFASSDRELVSPATPFDPPSRRD